MDIMQKAAAAKSASRSLAICSSKDKNEAIKAIADALIKNTDAILAANRLDLDAAKASGMSVSMQDRLMLNKKRIADIAESALKVASLDDPVGKMDYMQNRPNGLKICRVHVPLGVIGIIYEARPNVTVDAALLCLKSGNAVILRGGKEAINSNVTLANIMREAVKSAGVNPECIQIIVDTSRETANAMMRLNGYIDVLIPRGGAGLIRSVKENASVPVIETGVGNCHVYIDSECDMDMGVNIIFNAKTSRPSVCNAAETLLVHKDVAAEFLPKAAAKLAEKNVEIRGCDITRSILKGFEIKAATDEDYATEYNDYILSVKVVNSLDEALLHIQKYGTMHSEAIVTTNYFNAQRFLNEVDAAAVYVNASTRFTDGGEFGLGAEIGISTQKMHARGPMGLNELTTTKYQIYGNGQIR